MLHQLPVKIHNLFQATQDIILADFFLVVKIFNSVFDLGFRLLKLSVSIVQIIKSTARKFHFSLDFWENDSLLEANMVCKTAHALVKILIGLLD